MSLVSETSLVTPWPAHSSQEPLHGPNASPSWMMPSSEACQHSPQLHSTVHQTKPTYIWQMQGFLALPIQQILASPRTRNRGQFMEALDDREDSQLMSMMSMGSPLARENSRFAMQGPAQSSLQSFTSSAAAGMRGGPSHSRQPQPKSFSFRVSPGEGFSQDGSSETTSASGRRSERHGKRQKFTMPSMLSLHGGSRAPGRPIGPLGTEMSLRDQYSLAGRPAAQHAGVNLWNDDELSMQICIVLEGCAQPGQSHCMQLVHCTLNLGSWSMACQILPVINLQHVLNDIIQDTVAAGAASAAIDPPRGPVNVQEQMRKAESAIRLPAIEL